MNRPRTAREALIAEAIGDLAHLLDRADALQPGLRKSTQALTEANAQLTRRLAAFEVNLVALTEQAKGVAVNHILARTNEAVRRSLDEQTQAMSDAARKLFATEVSPTLKNLAAPLQRLVESVDRPWDMWWTHVATAIATANVTWLAIHALQSLSGKC